MKIYCLLIIPYLFLTCSKRSNYQTGFDIVDIPKAFQNQKEISLSQFVDSIEYIKLEETDQSLLFSPMIEVTNDYIIARNSGPTAMGPILLFDRGSGKFIRGIGKSGRGPGEFHIGNSTFYNTYSATLYGLCYSQRDIVEFDTVGNLIGNFKLPIMIDKKVNPKFGTPNIELNQYFSKDTFVASVPNILGWDDRRIVIYSKDTIIKIFPNYLLWERKNWRFINSIGSNTIFFRWNDILSFKEELNDTIFQLTKSTLIPRFVFLTSDRNPKPQLMEQMISFELLAKYYFFKNISENDNYLFFELEFDRKIYTCFFDKRKKITTICKLKEDSKSGFIDDINGFMPIRPLKITQNNEMICKLEAEDIYKWFQENPEKSKNLNIKLNWLKLVSPSSNPIIVIAKFK